ncbi:hypothetical protein ACFSCW_03590 [Sphingomonas tabacisoli]|uniref:DUF2845 domain-containing protein n=1 Tax=Sphingomonas tabacisoli TaxID=2249466 RepID=A0ABW4I1F2_9SPHN
MLAGLSLALLASLAPADHAGCRAVGNVIHAKAGKALVCVGDRSAPGKVHTVRRLASVGTPGRIPHFRWVETGHVRVERIEGRVAEATVLRGPVQAGHRIAMD